METIPTTSRSLDRYYHINGDTFERQYKEILSGYREWSELSHAEEWLVFPGNIGESICIDETAPSNGELYTVVTNRASRGGRGTITAIVKGVAAEAVTEALMRIDEDKRMTVREITMDMSGSMRLIARRCFPKAIRTIDRFHIQKLACDALQEMRIAHRWDAIQAETDAREGQDAWGRHTLRPYLRTGTRTGSCWRAADTCCSSPQKNGRKVRGGEPRSSLRHTLI